MPRQLLGTAIAANTITTTQLQTTVVNQISAGGGPRVSSLIYPGNDTAGNTVGGQTVYINGSGFETNNAIYINGNAVPSKSFISASNLSFTTPALSAGIYPVYVINTDNGATAIFIPGYISSAEPTWVSSSSLAEVGATDSWSISLSSTGDTPITYALAGGSSLPSGITLAANGLISGTLSSPPESETQYTFTVVASDAQNQDASRQFTVTVTTGEGVLFANNVLLIHSDGTNNGNNQSFVESTASLTVTRTGAANQGSFSPFAQTGWSGYFDGTTDSVSFNSIELTSDFTIEAWIYPERAGNGGGGQALIFAQSSPNQQFTHNADGTIGYYNGSVFTNTTTTVSLERWTHVAWVRSGSSTRIYINGANSAINSSDSGSRYIQRIGEFVSPTGYAFKGFISNARVTANAMYSGSSFSLPTSPLSVTANTKLLTLNSNRVIDSNTTPLTLTRDNDIKVIPFSPFAPTSAYSSANVGGSVYIPSGANGLTIGSVPAIGTGSFTVEGWFWPTTTGEFPSVWTLNIADFNGSSSVQAGVGTAVINFRYNGQGGFNVTTGINLANQWNHIAWVRNGSAANVYLNGISVGSGSFTNSISGGSAYIARPDSSSFKYEGWVSGFRVVSGTALYTANFTPPTAPPTSSSNAICLLNFTNGQVIDHTAKNILELAGDAKVSTAQFKYGTGSISFDGTSDYIKILKNATLLNFGSGDFTVETWVRFNTVGADQAILGSDGTTGAYDILYRTGVGLVIGRYNTAFDSNFSWSPSINTWYHIAWCRSGSSLRAFVDGVQIGSTATNTNAYNGGTNYSVIGASDASNTRSLNGFLDDLRITKGYARYTSNFTPPTSALKDR
jgi:hypothetical protein